MTMLAAAQIAWPDWIVLIGYFVIMLGIGAYFYRYMRSMKAYFSGGNVIPWWLSGVSFYMTSFSAFLFVTYSENAHRFGLVAVVLGWMAAPAVLLGAAVFASRWRRARIDSPVEYLEERYSLGMRQVLGWANIPVRLIDNGLRLFATGSFVAVTLGFDVYWSIVGCGVVTLLYTFAGGLWAVTVTDFVQFVVMMVGAILLVPLAMMKTGGAGGFFTNMPANTWTLTADDYTGLYLISWFLLLACNYNQSFGLVQRYYSVRNEREAKKVAVFVAVLILVGTPIFVAPALAARQFMPGEASKDIYGTLCRELLPTGALGLVIAAMFSATMSSLSGDYNVLAAVLTNDVYKRLLDKQASERRLVLVGRLLTVAIGVIPVAIALYLAWLGGDRPLFRKMVTVFAVAAAPIAIPMLAGLVWRRASNIGAVAGLVAGLIVGLTLFYLIDNEVIRTHGRTNEIVLTFSTVATTTVFLVAFSLLFPAQGEHKRRSEAFSEKLRTPVPALEVAVGGVPAPFRVVGLCTIAVAVLLLVIQPFMDWNAGSKTNLAAAIVLLLPGIYWTVRAGKGGKAGS